MELERIDLQFFQKDDLNSNRLDGIRHIKTLPYLSVVQAIEGTYDIQLGSGPIYNTGTGGFFLAPANIQQTIIHHGRQNDQQMIARWVFLDVRLNNHYSFDDVYAYPALLPEAYQTQMHAAFDRLFAAKDTFQEYCCYYEIVRILASAATGKNSRCRPTWKPCCTIFGSIISTPSPSKIWQQLQTSRNRICTPFSKNTSAFHPSFF